MLVDPVCGKSMEARKAHAVITFRGSSYYLCCPRCETAFEHEPEKYVGKGGICEPNPILGELDDGGAPLVYSVTVTSGAK